MRTFTIIWLGQIVSTIGTYMTEFALIIWAWELTGSATALALVGFFSQLPRIPITLFAGIIIDCFNRKRLMILGDAVAAVSTIAILLLYLTDNLQIWHLYLTSAVNGSFGQIQQLAYSTSIAMIVPQQHYTRASSMGSMVHYGSAIFAPALAGSLYPVVGLLGILLIDLTTFTVAIATLVAVNIPQPSRPDADQQVLETLTFGLRYIWNHRGLRALLVTTALFWFAHDLGGAIYDPMILARTDGSAQLLGSVAASAGVGGVTGAVIISVWGGPKRRIDGMLLGFIGAGLSKTVFGLGRTTFVWIPAQFCSSLNFPLLSSAETALWMANVAPEMQGRVFAANALILQIVSAIAIFIAGPLAERVFEPAMSPGGKLVSLLGGIFSSGSGAGMAVLYVITAISLLLVGCGGFAYRELQELEPIKPNRDNHTI